MIITKFKKFENSSPSSKAGFDGYIRWVGQTRLETDIAAEGYDNATLSDDVILDDNDLSKKSLQLLS